MQSRACARARIRPSVPPTRGDAARAQRSRVIFRSVPNASAKFASPRSRRCSDVKRERRKGTGEERKRIAPYRATEMNHLKSSTFDPAFYTRARRSPPRRTVRSRKVSSRRSSAASRPARFRSSLRYDCVTSLTLQPANASEFHRPNGLVQRLSEKEITVDFPVIRSTVRVQRGTTERRAQHEVGTFESCRKFRSRQTGPFFCLSEALWLMAFLKSQFRAGFPA